MYEEGNIYVKEAYHRLMNLRDHVHFLYSEYNTRKSSVVGIIDEMNHIHSYFSRYAGIARDEPELIRIIDEIHYYISELERHIIINHHYLNTNSLGKIKEHYLKLENRDNIIDEILNNE